MVPRAQHDASLDADCDATVSCFVFGMGLCGAPGPNVPGCGRTRKPTDPDRHTTCTACRKRAKRKYEDEDDKENMDPNVAVRQHLISALPSSRQRKPFEQLQP